MGSYASPDGLVVRALRSSRSNPSSNTGLERKLFAKQITGTGGTQTDHRKTTDASQIHEKITQQKAVPSAARKKISNFSIKVIRTSAANIRPNRNQFLASAFGKDRLVVRTLRCGTSKPGSNPGRYR